MVIAAKIKGGQIIPVRYFTSKELPIYAMHCDKGGLYKWLKCHTQKGCSAACTEVFEGVCSINKIIFSPTPT